MQRSPAFDSPLPRYSRLALCIRLALYGQSPLVQHMIERNQMMDAMAQLGVPV
jgi:hypothetical protein